jgi:cytochrome c oxidase subunit 3
MDNLPLPALVGPAIGTLAILGGAAAMYYAKRDADRTAGTGMKIGLAVAILLGAVALATIVLDLRSVPFDHRINAYGSIYWATSVLMAGLILFGLGQGIFTLAGAFMGHYNAREHVAVMVGSLYWYGLALFWAVLAATLYLAPHVLG